MFNQDIYFKRTVKFVGEPMSHLESIASSAVHYRSLSILTDCIFSKALRFYLSMLFLKHCIVNFTFTVIIQFYYCYILGMGCGSHPSENTGFLTCTSFITVTFKLLSTT